MMYQEIEYCECRQKNYLTKLDCSAAGKEGNDNGSSDSFTSAITKGVVWLGSLYDKKNRNKLNVYISFKCNLLNKLQQFVHYDLGIFRNLDILFMKCTSILLY